MKTAAISFAVVVCLTITSNSYADWTRFLGSDGTGISKDATPPQKWSDDSNLAWKIELPGAGSASPIVAGDLGFLICYSGEGQSLERQLVCVDLSNGDIKWSKTIDAVQPEDPNRGYITEHGYASNTPVTDGEHVFAFFGKSGVYAFDLDGNELWNVGVGTESSNRQWGSAASLILHGDHVIVNAAEESRSIRALNKATGEEVWKAEADMLELAYGTPNLVKLEDGSEELLIGVPDEIWGLNPSNGKLKWYASTNLTGNICPSVVHHDGTVYLFGGYRSSGSHAVRLGGKGDVSDTHMEWSTRTSSYVATPLFHDGHLYWVDDRGLAYCVSAETGDVVYQERLEGLSSGGRPVYASPVMADGKIYVVSRRSGTFVFAAKPELEILSINRFASDESDFNATPAFYGNKMLIRSNRFLYCISE